MTASRVVLALSIAAVTIASLGLGLLGGPVGAFSAHDRSLQAPASGLSAAPAVSASPHAALEQKILATAKADHIPLAAVSLPNLMGQAHVSNGVVSPIPTAAPAPMGIGTIGVLNTTGKATAYTITTSSWEGSITINNVNTFLLDNDGAYSESGNNNTFGVQLNAVTNDTTVGSQSTYAFWAQNVLYWNLYPGTVTLLDNIWNFSSPAVSLTSGTIYSGNGTPVYPEYYYDFGPTIAVTLPVTVHLYLNSSITDLPSTGDAYTTLRFGYDIVNAATGRSEGAGVYDTVLFNSNRKIGTVPASPFLVDGSQLTPTNFLLYDAEIMIGGPGGGTTTSVYGISGSEQLQYLDNGRYVTPASAWDVGTDTGETSEGVAETYQTPGTVELSAGPSIPEPFWGATPGGNAGSVTFSGTLSPTNAFLFVTPGATFNENDAAWAPTQTSSHISLVLPPGKYTVQALLSDYTPAQTTVSATRGGGAALSFALKANAKEGVYTPLVAWDNAQLAAISSSGTGSAAHPYLLDNNPASGGLDAVFGQFNDYLFGVFPGVLLAGTTAYVDLTNPSTLGLTYQTSYDTELTNLGLPETNHLQFELYDASDVSLWGAQGITGWFFYEDYGPTGLLPLANVVVWGGSHDLIGDSTFISQGSSLLLAGLSPTADNVVWGNHFVNSSAITPTMYPGDGASNGPPIGIFAFESGDLIYNNYVATTITAFAPDVNFFTGAGQLNTESWNLPAIEPASYAVSFNGFTLSGTIVRSAFQGGNFWSNYVAGSPLPYNNSGYIASGGDAFPLPIVAYAVTFELSERGPGVAWSVTLNGYTQATTSTSLTFYEEAGTYGYSDAVVSGHGSISPASGTVTVSTHNVVVDLSLS